MDSRTPVVTALVVGVLVVAGCGAPAAGPGPTQTLTPAPVPERTATPAEPLPPGVAGGDVTDVDALVATHAAAVKGRSFTVRIRTEYDDLSGFRELRVESARRYAFRDATVTTAGNRTEFVDGKHRYSRSTRNGLEFGLHAPANRSERYGWMIGATLRSVLPTGNVSVFRTRIDGARYYELRTEAPAHPRFERFGNYSARATVRSDGFVRHVTVSYVRQYRGRQTNVTRIVAYTDVGSTTVERPDWVDRWWGTDPTPRGAGFG